VVAISSAVRDQLRRDGIAEERLAVVPSGIDLEAIRGAPHEHLRAWAGIPNGGALVVTVAALTAEKGLLTLVAAFAMLLKERDIRWVVIGDGPLRSVMESFAADPAFKGRLAFPGFHPEPTRLLRDADLFVLPSRSEGLGTSVLDAMALELPVVATDVGGLPELLAGDAGLLVPVDEPRALATAVGRLLDDGALRAKCLAAGRATAARYTARGMAAGMQTVYASVDANR
jgi:glycosyltransferase involved in cell wall biosynthesis